MRSTPPPDRAIVGPDEDELPRLQSLLDQVPEPLVPLDVSAVDGFLCGLLLQPNEIESRKWLPCVTDLEARPLPASFDARPLHALLLKRHAYLQQAIGNRQWFDPWVFELDSTASPSECVLPWVAGFAAAMDRFPALMQLEDPRLLEPLSLIYLHFDPEDLEDSDALQAVIDTLEPPADLAEAVQDLVRSVMLLADVTRPVQAAAKARRTRRR